MIRAERIPSHDDRAEIFDPPPPRRWGRFLVLFALAVVLVGGGAWAWLVHGKRMTGLFAGGGEGVAVVRADPAPFKIRPRDPGGMEVPDRDKLVYGRLQGEGSESGVERLLAPPEAPLRPPFAAMAPAPQVKESLPRTPTEAQVRAAVKPPPLPALDSARAISGREPAPEDSPPTDPETAPSNPSASAPGAEAPKPNDPAAPFAPGPLSGRPAPPGSMPAAPSVPERVSPAPQPVPAKEPASAEPAASSAEAAASAAKAGSGYLIQIAAVREPERADAEWERLQRQHPETLRGLKLFVARADLGDKGVFWRLRAGPFADEAAAKNRCAELASRKVGCLVVKAQG